MIANVQLQQEASSGTPAAAPSKLLTFINTGPANLIDVGRTVCYALTSR